MTHHRLNLQAAVRTFMETAGDRTDQFNARQITLYTGLQLEEMAEKLEAILAGAVSEDSRFELRRAISVLTELSEQFKKGIHLGDVLRGDRVALLDADIDLAWCSLGAAFSTSNDTDAAIGEVIRSNLDKFPGGVATRDVNGKILKPADWRGPQLELLVDAPTV